MKLKLPTARLSRDTILLTVGLAGLAYETLSGRPQNDTLILGFIGMIGTPVVIRRGEAKDRDDAEKDRPVNVTKIETDA